MDTDTVTDATTDAFEHVSDIADAPVPVFGGEDTNDRSFAAVVLPITALVAGGFAIRTYVRKRRAAKADNAEPTQDTEATEAE